jgi:excisionase family DNA binding protein
MHADLLTPTELAQELSVPESTLTYWRHTRQGPAFFKAGRLVRYRRSAVDEWIERQELAARTAS